MLVLALVLIWLILLNTVTLANQLTGNQLYSIGLVIFSDVSMFTVTWKPFDIGTAQRLLKPLDADWKELANYLLKEKNDERIKSIDANCSTDKVGNKALNEAVLTWRRRTASDKRKWSTLCEVAGKWGDKTLEEYLNTEKLARE